MQLIKNPEKSEFYRKLTVLVLPIAFQQFMLAVVSASDAVMLGMVGQSQMSAVSLAGQVQFVLSLFLAAMTIGTSTLSAQYWGQGNKTAVEKIFAFVLKWSVGVSVCFFWGASLFPETVMRVFTTDAALIAGGSEYLRTVGLSYILCGASQIYLCIMKNSGRAARSMVITSVAVLMNLVLNAVFIFGLAGAPKMGIAGAAVATVISRLVELLWAFSDSLRPGQIRARLGYLLHTNAELRRDFWRYTSPVLGNEIVWGCGFTMYSVIMGHMGNDAVAANSLANIVKNLIACFCMGLGSGGAILVGNELGAGHLERAKEYGRQLCRLSIISGIITGIFLLLISPVILSAANLTTQAEGYLTWMLIMCSYYMIGKSVNSTTIAGIFCAGGDSRFGFLCDTITLWCITIPLALIAAFWFKLPVPVVYFIANMDEILKLPAVYRHYRKYIWVKNLTETGKNMVDSGEIVC